MLYQICKNNTSLDRFQCYLLLLITQTYTLLLLCFYFVFESIRAGGPIIASVEPKNGHTGTVSKFLAVPPLGVVMSQEMKEEESLNADGEKSIVMKLERHVCGITSSISEQSLMLHLFKMCTTLGSASECEFYCHFPYL